ncbi:hypothetical protein FDP22_19875 (plasmid) [Paroceanicella profunda]|uniref:DUF1127 domain-containing protein n=1 Tax=Paroceanicella profunda TaxID=2579971 RepID=A0A5B8FJC2_9RHOB|nr:hypothetical protein [Paroceanicella profunda]QDL94118.1 hypothetical protein FDP22_19875 [Paroceanicella profunda]
MITAIRLTRDIPFPGFVDSFLAARRHRQRHRLEQCLRRDLPLYILRDIGLSDEAPAPGFRL